MPMAIIPMAAAKKMFNKLSKLGLSLFIAIFSCGCFLLPASAASYGSGLYNSGLYSVGATLSGSAISYQTPAQLIAGTDTAGAAAVFTINNNIPLTAANRLITLKFNNFNNSLINRLAISTTTDFSQSSLIDYAPEISYDLCGSNTACPDGQYTVYAKYYTNYGQSSLATPLVVTLKSGIVPATSQANDTSAFVTLEKSLTKNISSSLSNRLSGRILLQVESHGEAWYVNPVNDSKYYLGRPADAFAIMRQLGLGISNQDYVSFNGQAPARLSGRILLRVENHGEAYYVNPLDLKMHYLGRPADAFAIMRGLGLGIANTDLRRIDIGEVK